MTIRAALTRPSVKRLIALTVVYVLALQALFGAAAQMRVLLSDAPGLCTILGFQGPDQPKHAPDACAVHCVAQISADMSGLAALAAATLALAGWSMSRTVTSPGPLRAVLAYRGRGPPR